MRRHGRTKPYTEIGVQRLPCARCGKPADQQWNTCADGFWRPICVECDIELNEMVLKFMKDPSWKSKMKQYRKEMGCKTRNDG